MNTSDPHTSVAFSLSYSPAVGFIVEVIFMNAHGIALKHEDVSTSFTPYKSFTIFCRIK